MSDAAVSRNLRALGPVNKDGGSGYNLIDTNVHPDDARMKVILLTKRGERVLQRMLGHLGHGEKEELPKARESHGYSASTKAVPAARYVTKKYAFKKGKAHKEVA